MGSAALLLGVLLLVISFMPVVGPAVAKPAAADPPAISGVYDCQGVGADGKPYKGAVIIEPDGNRFLVQWYISAQLSAIGLGIRDGDMLAVSFFGADAGGVVLYRISGERLVGHWSAPLSGSELFEETLVRVGNLPAAGSPPPAGESAPARPRPTGRARPIVYQPAF